jgi:RES domain-containing protein
MDAYRIADGRYAIYDPTGASLHGGRWNSVGRRVIYASESYAAALLEVLVHRNAPSLPKHHLSVHILIPDNLTVETVRPENLHGWDDEDNRVSKAFGDVWFDSRRSPVLRVPSVVTRGPEFNLLLNTLHPQFKRIHADKPVPVLWDKRLAAKSAKRRS